MREVAYWSCDLLFFGVPLALLVALFGLWWAWMEARFRRSDPKRKEVRVRQSSE